MVKCTLLEPRIKPSQGKAMDKNTLNRMNKDLQEFKSKVENSTPTTENLHLIERLREQIEGMENTFMELRGEDNPANKIYQWFKNHFTTDTNYHCFSIKAKDQTFELLINAEKAFNLNLRYEPNSWRAQQPTHWGIIQTIASSGVMFNPKDGWFPLTAFEPYLFPQSVTSQYRNISIEFKYSRKIFRHPEEMNEFLSKFIEHAYACCLRHRLPKENSNE